MKKFVFPPASKIRDFANFYRVDPFKPTLLLKSATLPEAPVDQPKRAVSLIGLEWMDDQKLFSGLDYPPYEL